MLALNLESIGPMENCRIRKTTTSACSAAHLDLVGVNAVGLFYLAMRRGLDYLAEHPSADASRLGVTGLSHRRGLANDCPERAG